MERCRCRCGRRLTAKAASQEATKSGPGVALEFDFVFVATLDCGCEGGVDGEQEEMMVAGGGIPFSIENSVCSL